MGPEEKRKRDLCRKTETKTNAKTLGSKAEESKTSRAKPQVVAKAYQNALRTKTNSRARSGHRASPCGGDVEAGRNITRKIPPEKLNENLRKKRVSPEESKVKTGKTGF